jgi:hypothetical protein
LAFLAQSAISINQLGLAVWGWVILGTIIGLERNSEIENINKFSQNMKNAQLPAINLMSGTLGFVAGILISIWPFTYDLNFRSAISTGKSEEIQKRALSFPSNNYHMLFAARAFSENGLSEEAYLLLQRAVSNNPRDFNAIDALSRDARTSPEEQEFYKLRLKRIDPLNPNLKDGQ